MTDKSDHQVSDEQKQEMYERIKKDPQVYKFGFYGFFKNLKFFEPYLLIIFLAIGFDLFTWGLLMMVQEILTYVLEVPSGVLADKYGKKMVMMLCFVWYIISFILYFFGLDPSAPSIILLVVATIFFGLGESFRSGTHKAMEVVWLEKEGLLDYKTFLYGRTRSFSLIGSALSGVLSVVFLLIIQIPPNRTIFLLSILPYVIDFILLSTYPSYMNESTDKEHRNIKDFVSGFKDLRIIFRNRKLGKALLSSTTHDAIFKTLKDYIQPIMKLTFGTVIAVFIVNPTQDQLDFYIPVIIGLMYTVFYFISAFTSRNSYRVKEKLDDTKKAMDIMFDILGIMLVLTGIFVQFEISVIIIVIYLLIYMAYNLRRPLVVDYIATIIDPKQRATMLSVESLLKSVFVFIFAPLFGFIAESISIAVLFIGLGIVVVIVNRLALSGDCNPEGTACDLEVDDFSE